VNKPLNRIYRKNGEIDGRCGLAREWKMADARIDTVEVIIDDDRDEAAYRDLILQHWHSLTDTERAFEKLCNSHTWHISEYAMRTAPEHSNYYYNSQGVLTAPEVDPTLSPQIKTIFGI
jgi:hypothetical protein